VTYVIGLVSLLVALAGIIAYAGDRLGTWVGRRRLTVFGARPRLTGQIVGVVVGILIMLTTLGVLAIAFQNATQTLVNAQRTADELGRLRVQERVLAAQLTQLGADLGAARATVRSAEAARDAALQDRDAAEAERDEVLFERDELLTEIAATQEVLAELSAQLEAAGRDLRTIEHELGVASIERDTARLEAETARNDAGRARGEAQSAQLEALEARAEAEELEAQMATVAADLDATNVRLLELQVQLSEADANVIATVARLGAAETALREAEGARGVAVADRDAAIQAQDEARAEAERLELQVRSVAGDLTLANSRLRDLQLQLSEADAEVAAALSRLATAERAALEAEAARSAALVERDVARAARDAAQAEADDLQRANDQLQTVNRQLATNNTELGSANAALQELNARLRTEIIDANQSLRGLEAQVAQLTDRLEEEARKLSEVSLEFSRVASGEMTFERDQVIFSGPVFANEPVAVREELADFVRRASTTTTGRGAGEVVLTSEQFNSLVEVISETESSDLVRFISPRNQFSPTQVEVLVEAIENTRVFERGRLLVARPVHLGTVELPATQEEIRFAIAQLKGEALRVARRAGLDELQAPEYRGVSDESFMNQLLRLTGPAVIGVATVAAVDRAGPALVELVILY
jgi:uncharacterized protein (DUF3084 family)